MKVKLPRECKGKEILEALKKAVELESTDNRVIDTRDVDHDFEYQPGSVEQVLLGVGLEINFWTTHLKKRFHFFGRIIGEKVIGGARLVLQSLDFNENYNEVYFDIVGTLSVYSEGRVVNCNHMDYLFIKNRFEKVLERFYALLAPMVA